MTTESAATAPAVNKIDEAAFHQLVFDLVCGEQAVCALAEFLMDGSIGTAHDLPVNGPGLATLLGGAAQRIRLGVDGLHELACELGIRNDILSKLVASR